MSESNTVKSKVKISPTEEIEVPMRFEMSEFVPSVLAQHMSLQATPDNIIVGFYEADLPIVFNSTPEAIEILKQEGYAAECVARIAIPASRFNDFARVFAQAAGLLDEKESEDQDANTK